MTIDVTLIHDKQNGVIKLKINGENARIPWAYGDNQFLEPEYLNEAKIAAFEEACSQCILTGKPVNISFNVF